MIRTIHLRHFKKFKDAKITLSPFTILMGENSSGKTTILQAIAVAQRSLYDLRMRNSIRIKDGTVEIKEKQNSRIYYINELPFLTISKVGDLYYGGKASPKQPAFIELIDSSENIYRIKIQSTFGTNSEFGNFNVRCDSSPEDFHVPQDIMLLSQPLMISGLTGLHATEERKFPKAIEDKAQTGKMSEIIRNLLLDIKQSEGNAYAHFSHILKRYFDFHIDTIKFDEKQDLYITASFLETRDGQDFSLNLNSSGSGLLQILQIFAPIYRFASKGTVVLLDEPDAHLHPNVQYTLAQALRAVQRELDIQIIISTHSIPMIEAAEPYEVMPVHAQMLHIEPLEDRADVDAIIAERLDNYHLGKAKISGKIVFVEDRNIEILKRLDEASGVHCFLGINTTPCVPGDGKDDKAPFNAKKTLKAYTQRDVEAHFVVDNDAMPERWRAHFAKYAEGKVILHQLVRHEIENYLINPELIVRALKAKSPRKVLEIPDAEDLRKVLIDIMKEFMTSSIEFFKDSLEARLEHLVSLTRRQVEEEEIDKETKQKKKFSKHFAPDDVKKEAKNILRTYYNYSEFDQLVMVAPGKEVLSKLNIWLTEHTKMHLSKMEIAKSLTEADVPDDLKHLFMQLRSNAVEPSNE